MLSGLGAVQIAILSPEVLLQTAVLGLVLVPTRPRARQVYGLAVALIVACLLAAPTLLGVLALVSLCVWVASTLGR